MSRLRSSTGKLAVAVIALLACAWLTGLIFYARQVPQTIEDSQTRTDAIVVLTGGSERVETGIALLSQGLANQLFISGVGQAVRPDALVPDDTPNRDALIARMSVGTEAEDTPGNAVETAKWAQENGIQSLRLVTAAYHMPRSLREMEQAMPNVTLIPHPVFPDQVKAQWWRYPGTAGLLSREYSKYLAASLRLFFNQAKDS